MERVRKLLLAQGYDASAIKAIEKAVKKEVDAAVEESKVRHNALGLGAQRGLCRQTASCQKRGSGCGEQRRAARPPT